METLFGQCESGEPVFGAIVCPDKLRENLQANCLPEILSAYEMDQYETFLANRRIAMAEKIKAYYWAL